MRCLTFKKYFDFLYNLHCFYEYGRTNVLSIIPYNHARIPRIRSLLFAFPVPRIVLRRNTFIDLDALQRSHAPVLLAAYLKTCNYLMGPCGSHFLHVAGFLRYSSFIRNNVYLINQYSAHILRVFHLSLLKIPCILT